MPRDHYVGFRSEETIAQAATRLREHAGVASDLTFDIILVAENVLPTILKGKSFQVKFYDRSFKEDDPGFVSFNPLTLNVDRGIWAAAKAYDGDARFVIAHETGHIVLHDNSAKAFSNDRSAQIGFADQGQSAEWQANMFAAHLLLPDHIVEKIDDYERLVTMCDVPRALALERLLDVRRQKERARHRARQFEGGFCPKCGNFSMLRTNTLLKCTTVGCEYTASRF